MQKPLTLDTLGDLDNGVVRLMVDKELARAVADLHDRGTEDGKRRRVTIDIDLALHEGLVLTRVEASAKLPRYKSKATVAKLKVENKTPKCLFEDLNPRNPDQPAFRQMDQEDK